MDGAVVLGGVEDQQRPEKPQGGGQKQLLHQTTSQQESLAKEVSPPRSLSVYEVLLTRVLTADRPQRLSHPLITSNGSTVTLEPRDVMITPFGTLHHVWTTAHQPSAHLTINIERHHFSYLWLLHGVWQIHRAAVQVEEELGSPSPYAASTCPGGQSVQDALRSGDVDLNGEGGFFEEVKTEVKHFLDFLWKRVAQLDCESGRASLDWRSRVAGIGGSGTKTRHEAPEDPVSGGGKFSALTADEQKLLCVGKGGQTVDEEEAALSTQALLGRILAEYMEALDHRAHEKSPSFRHKLAEKIVPLFLYLENAITPAKLLAVSPHLFRLAVGPTPVDQKIGAKKRKKSRQTAVASLAKQLYKLAGELRQNLGVYKTSADAGAGLTPAEAEEHAAAGIMEIGATYSVTFLAKGYV